MAGKVPENAKNVSVVGLNIAKQNYNFRTLLVWIAIGVDINPLLYL